MQHFGDSSDRILNSFAASRIEETITHGSRCAVEAIEFAIDHWTRDSWDGKQGTAMPIEVRLIVHRAAFRPAAPNLQGRSFSPANGRFARARGGRVI
jgi:hypothetical protein